MLKVLSWFRSKPAPESSGRELLPDAWRLDEEPPRRADRRPRPERAPPESRPPESRRPSRPPDWRPIPLPEIVAMPEPRALPRRKPVPVPLSGEGVLAAFGLVKSFGGRRVVNDVSIDLERGEAVGLLGPNGAGKTTVFYMITGLIRVDSGRIELDGHDVTKLPMYRRARLGIGYLPQEASIFRGLNVEDNIRAVLEVIEPDAKQARARSRRAARRVQHRSRCASSPAIALSGGERRRVEIARALATRPAFMLLDEPFAGIDPIAVGDIQELVRHLTARGIGVLITDHNVRETLGLIDRAYIIHSGEILMEGEPDEIVSNPDVRRLYLGEEFRL